MAWAAVIITACSVILPGTFGIFGAMADFFTFL